MGKKLTEREKQAISTKLKISEISMSLIKSKGFKSVSVKDICDAGNISIGAFYHHFKSKKEIINTAYKKIDLQLQEEFEFKEFDSQINKIVNVLEEGASQVEKFGVDFVREVYKNLISDDNQYTFCGDRYVNCQVKKSIEDALDSGEITSKIDSAELSNTIMRITRGVIFDWCLKHGSYNLKDKVKSDLNLIFRNPNL